MRLHLFNPSHDEALAANYPYYYPSTIARQYETAWAPLPALWARPGDVVWVPGGLPPEWQTCWERHFGHLRLEEHTVISDALWNKVDRILPWGWDRLVRHRLTKAGAPEHLLPSDEELDCIRHLSSRETTAVLLPRLRERLSAHGIATIGESQIIRSEAEWTDSLKRWPEVMVKSLWSCSGRGVFGVKDSPTASDLGRLRRLLREQGAFEVEPRYEVVTNFALEFALQNDGHVRYEGLSLFGTAGAGAYAGNVWAGQDVLIERVEQALALPGSVATVAGVCAEELACHLSGCLPGPLGIDMLVARTADGPRLMPCVEVNLRRTMGHATLALWRSGLTPRDLPDSLRDLWPAEA